MENPARNESCVYTHEKWCWRPEHLFRFISNWIVWLAFKTERGRYVLKCNVPHTKPNGVFYNACLSLIQGQNTLLPFSEFSFLKEYILGKCSCTACHFAMRRKLYHLAAELWSWVFLRQLIAHSIGQSLMLCQKQLFEFQLVWIANWIQHLGFVSLHQTRIQKNNKIT